jgi:D-alanyl-D-alanine carboxypeptidase (penicillin-binding protein 5/6)
LTLVEQIGGGEESFVARMNAAAAALGMDNTRFVNSTGLIRDGHYTSARDLNRLATALIRQYPEYYQRWYALREFSHNGLTQYNRNTLLWSLAGADGMKTGHTRTAGYCLIASAVRARMRLMATVLGATDDKARARAGTDLLEFGFREYETRLLYQEQVPAINVRVWLGDTDMLPAGPDQDIYLTLPRSRYADLKASIQITQAPRAPISKGDSIGTLSLMLGQEQIAQYPLRALKDVGAGNTAHRLLDNLRMWLQ